MPWPIDPLGAVVELHLGDLGWVDITDDVRLESAASGGGISITRGRSAEGQDTEPTRANLTIDNRTGKYSPRNPLSPYYGLLGRNTPLRVRVTEAGGASALALSGKIAGTSGVGSAMSTPAAAALAVSGDVDIRIDASVPNGWRPNQTTMLAGRYLPSGSDRSWYVQVDRLGQLHFAYSTDGSVTNRVTVLGPVINPVGDRASVRITFQPAAGLMRFYTAPSLAGPWTQQGITYGFPATTMAAAPNAPLSLGSINGLATAALAGFIHGFEYRSGVDGAVLAAPDIAGMEAGQYSLTDQFGRVWTLADGAEIVDQASRCYVEAAVWPSRWDLGEFDRWVPLEGSGILRRVSQGASPRRSPLYRTLLKRNPAGYLPLEDEADSARPSSAASGITTGDSVGIEFGSDVRPRGARSAVTFGLDGILSTSVAVRSGSTWWVMFLFKLDHLPTPGNYRPLGRVYTHGGTAAYYEINLGDGGFQTRAIDRTGAAIGADQAWGWGSDVDPLGWTVICFQIRQDPGNTVRFGSVFHRVGGTLYFGTFEGPTFSGAVGRINRVEFSSGTEYENLRMSHLIIDNSTAPIFDSEFRLASDGYLGEPAGNRILRLCREDDIPCHVYGQPSETMAMGPQPEAPLVELLRQAAKADGGILAESRGMLGFQYRTRRSLYNQPTLPLSYSAGHIAAPFEPVEDDDAAVNDMTMSRDGGGSARYVKESGPLSTLPPPQGVGVYDSSETANVAYDSDLYDLAGWKVNLGTVDEPRYPRITVDLRSTAWSSDLAKTQRAVNLELGDCLEIGDLPEFLPPGPVGAMIQGYTETIDAFRWGIQWNATPSAPWQVGIVGKARVAAADSRLALPLAAGDAYAWITNTERSGNWTTDPAHFPQDLRIGEERVTASVIARSADDGFDRTVSDGWGLGWELFNGAASEYAVPGTGIGTISPAALTSDRVAAWRVGGPDQDFTVRLPGIGTPTGGSYTVGLAGRMSDGSNFYRGIVSVNTGGVVNLQLWKRVGGSLTSLGSTNLGLNATSGIWIRFQALGDQIRVKAWQQATAQPPGWQLAATDTSLSGEYAGVLARREAGHTAPLAMQFDAFTVDNPQKVTFPFTTPAVNPNPGFEVDTSGWTTIGATLVRSTAQAYEGAASGLVTPNGTQAFPRAETFSYSVPSRVVWGQARVRPTAASKSPRIAIHAFTSAGAYLATRGHTNGTPTAGAWQLISTPMVDFTDLPTAERFAVAVGLNNDGGINPTASDTVYVDQAELHPAPGYPGTVVSGRGVNGRAYDWAAGTKVDVWQPARIAL